MNTNELDLNHVFVRNIALGLGIDLDQQVLDTEEIIKLQGTVSSCVICYYFAKTHFLVLADTVRRVCHQKSCMGVIEEDKIRDCITTWTKELEETGLVRDFHRVVSNLGVFDQNFLQFQDCMNQIDREFEENQDCIQYVTDLPILKLEDEIAKKKSVQNYITPEMNLEKVADYYALKDIGIDSYLEQRYDKEYQSEIIYII